MIMNDHGTTTVDKVVMANISGGAPHTGCPQIIISIASSSIGHPAIVIGVPPISGNPYLPDQHLSITTQLTAPALSTTDAPPWRCTSVSSTGEAAEASAWCKLQYLGVISVSPTKKSRSAELWNRMKYDEYDETTLCFEVPPNTSWWCFRSNTFTR